MLRFLTELLHRCYSTALVVPIPVVQGGSAGGGTDDDLIVQLNGVSAVAVAGGTAITISIS